MIDASAKGNLGRFINHSCDPNCRTEKVSIILLLPAFFCGLLKKGYDTREAFFFNNNIGNYIFASFTFQGGELSY